MRTVPLTEDAKCGPCPMRGVHLVCAGQMEPELCEGGDAGALEAPSALYTATFLAETVEVPPEAGDPPEEGDPPGEAAPVSPAPSAPPGHCGPCKAAKPRVSLDEAIRLAKEKGKGKGAGGTSPPAPPGA